MKKLKIKCPKCKSKELLVTECGTITTTFHAENGEINRKEGIHDYGDIYKLTAGCRNCKHRWTVRKALQIDDVIDF